MKKINLFLSIVILLLICSGNIYSQDWPQFRGPARDSKVTGFKAPAAWPAQLTLQWKDSVGTGDATPVLVGKFLYLNTRQGINEAILCIDAATGKEIWKTLYAASPVTGAAAQHPGPRSTPAVANGRIVTFGASGILTCSDASTGKPVWIKDNPNNTVPQFFTGTSPLIVDGLCIVHVGTKDNGEVLALDLKTGAEKWKWGGEGPAYASPSVMNIDKKKHVIVQTEKNLIALDLADGKLQWQIPTPVQQRFYNCVSPYIDGNKIYFTGQGTGTRAVEVSKQGTQYVTKDLWSTTEVGAKWNTPVLKDGFLYGFTDQKRVYCISAADGKTAWLDNTIYSDFSTIVDCGQVLIGLTQQGSLIVLKPDPKAYTEIAKYKVTESPTVYGFPVVAGNVIYVKDGTTLMMYRIN